MVRIFPLGESALTVEFSAEISVEANDRVIELAAYFETNKFPGFVEAVPAYASLTIFYDAATVRKNFDAFRSSFEAVKSLAEDGLRNLMETGKPESRIVEIPVCFDRESALDLEFVAAANDLTARAAIEIFTARIYRVYMLGFLPGFAYMGETDARLAVPRKNTPRLRVPPGSVAVANRQTGIYPFASPGGWQIIGKTDIELFAPTGDDPTLLRAGDRVKFYETERPARLA